MSKQTHERIYLTFNYPGAVTGGKTLMTGIKIPKKTLYITGWYEPPESSPAPEIQSFLYKGDVRGTTGSCSNNSWNILNYSYAPGQTVKATWEEIKFPSKGVTSGNSVASDTVIGVNTNPLDPTGTVNGYISIVI